MVGGGRGIGRVWEQRVLELGGGVVVEPGVKGVSKGSRSGGTARPRRCPKPNLGGEWEREEWECGRDWECGECGRGCERGCECGSEPQ